MDKKKLGIMVSILLLVSVSIGYGLGKVSVSEIPEKEKTAYQLIQEKIQ